MNFSYLNLYHPKDYSGELVRFVQQKMDGLRVLVRRDKDISVTTRSGKTDFWGRLPHHLEGLIQELPEQSAVDCELYAPGEQATEVVTLVNDRSPKLCLGAFAVPFWAGQDLRRESLVLALRLAGDAGWEFVPTERVGEKKVIDAEAYRKKARKLGFEGYVAKLSHYDGWYKIKPTKTADLVVLRYTLSDSITHFGKLKAIIVGLPDGTELASVGTGFDQEWRHSVHPPTLVGRVCEIEYDSVAAQGKLKFPRFLRWRDDKTRWDCTKEF